LQRLSDVRRGDGVGVGQIGDRAGQLEYAMQNTCRLTARKGKRAAMQ
jgi:hypothetical protein